MPVAALRAFEAAARHGRLVAAGEELGVTHSAVSRHVSHLEAFIGTPLFEGPRNRPTLTAEGRVLGFALTGAFDQIDAALRLVSRGDDRTIDVACLGTFAMRWLIPRLQDFYDGHPLYDVRLATDDLPSRLGADVRIDILPPGTSLPPAAILLFEEQLGLVMARGDEKSVEEVRKAALAKPRLETRTRPGAWDDWLSLARLSGQRRRASSRLFHHYHLTIEGALNGQGAAVAPWHLVAGEVLSGRLVAPFGFRPSGYGYVAMVRQPAPRKAEIFLAWLEGTVAAFPAPPAMDV